MEQLIQSNMKKGYHYIDTKLDEVVLFVRKGCCIPIAEPAEYVEQIDTKKYEIIWI